MRGGPALVAAVLSTAVASAGVVAINDGVPYPQLVGPAGTREDPTVFLFDGYRKDFDPLGQGLDVGTYHPYIALHIVNRSAIASSRIWFLGGDYPNKVDESGDPNAYPGHQTMLLDNSSMATGELRVGSKSRHNTLIVRNGAALSVGKGLYIDMHDGVGGNAVVVAGLGSSLCVTNGPLCVGYGCSSNETLSVLQGATVVVGTPSRPQRVRLRHAHDSTITVSGPGSILRVTGDLSLGESATRCHGNRLVVSDGGLVRIDGTLSAIGSAAKPPHAIVLTDGGVLAIRGTPADLPLLRALLTAGGSPVDAGTPGVHELADYTVWKAATATTNSQGTHHAITP